MNVLTLENLLKYFAQFPRGAASAAFDAVLQAYALRRSGSARPQDPSGYDLSAGPQGERTLAEGPMGPACVSFAPAYASAKGAHGERYGIVEYQSGPGWCDVEYYWLEPGEVDRADADAVVDGARAALTPET